MKHITLSDFFIARAAKSPHTGRHAPTDASRYTVMHRLTFRPGDARAAAMLSATPARRLVRGPFLMAMVDLDDDGVPELVVQRLPRSGGAQTRSTMVLKRCDGGYDAIYSSRLNDRLAVTNEKIRGYRGLAELDAGGGIRYDKDTAATTFGRQVVHVIQ